MGYYHLIKDSSFCRRVAFQTDRWKIVGASGRREFMPLWTGRPIASWTDVYASRQALPPLLPIDNTPFGLRLHLVLRCFHT